MGKLSDLFTQARKPRSGKGIGFVGKSGPTIKPRAAALLLEANGVDAASAEAAVKAGADGLIFSWDGKGDAEALTGAIEAAHGAGENVLCGLHLTGGWNGLERKDFETFKEQGVNFVIMPLEAPARLLALHVKDLESVVSVPMREGELYSVFVRNLSAFEYVAAIHLDFNLSSEVNSMSIEDVLHYRAVREAVRAPALVNVKGTLSEDEAYALLTLGVQALVLTEGRASSETEGQLQSLHNVLEEVYHDDRDASSLGLSNR